MHVVVEIDTSGIVDWDSFHDVFAKELGFPDFYGRNIAAWIDCMTYLDDPSAGMTQVHAPEGGVFVLALSDATGFAARCPEIFDALTECAAFVNYRRLEVGEPPVLALSYWKKGDGLLQDRQWRVVSTHLAEYVEALAGAASETTRSEDRPRYEHHLACAARMLAAAHRRAAGDLRRFVAEERRSFGWDFLSDECGARVEREFNRLASMIENLNDLR